MSEFQIKVQTSLDDSKAKEQLNKLISDGSNKKIKLEADTSSMVGTLNSVLGIIKNINTIANQVSVGGKSKGNSQTTKTLSEFKALQNQYNALQRQLSKEVNPKSMGVLKTQLGQVGNAINQVKSKMTETERVMAKAFTTTSTQKLEASFSKTFSSISSNVNKLGAEIKSAFNNPNVSMSQLNSLQTRFQGLQNMVNNFDMSKMSGESLNKLNSKLGELQTKFKGINTDANQLKLENKFNIDCSKTISQLEQLKKQYQTVGKDTSGIDNLIKKTQELQSGVGNVKLGTLQTGLNGVNTQVNQMQSSMKSLVGVSKTVKGTFSQIFQSFSTLAPGFLIGTALISGIRSIKTEILELDKSMTNLKKVAKDSDVATSSQIKTITNNAVQIAKTTAGSVSGIVNSMAEATKLGVKGGMKAAEEVAKYAQIFSNVGDMDVSMATQGIAQLINTFDINPLEKFKVSVNGVNKETTGLANSMDVLNFAGNNYAIDVAGLLSAMQNGGATMAGYGLSIQESTAMIVAANASLQDPTRVGNGLKSLAVNLAGIRTSAKDGSISVNKTAKALSNIAGIDVFTDKSKTQVKDMSTILDEVNKKWESLTDTQRKGLSEAIAGKQQSAVFNSLMKNYDQYEELMGRYAKGEHFNAAEKENSKYINSINGKLASLKATWTGIGSTLFNSDMLKGGVGALDAFSQGISKVITTIDKLNVGIPVTVAGMALLRTAFTSFKYAGNFADGLSLIGMRLTSIPASIAKIPASLSAFTGLNVTMMGLAGTIGAVALAFTVLKGIQVAVDKHNTKGTRQWEELNKSTKKYKKTLDDLNGKELKLSGTLDQYEKLSKITNKTAEEQKEYNKILKDLEKIDPNLVVYDENGSPIKARVGEVKDLVREYQKAQREQSKLLADDLKDKSSASRDKYKEQVNKRNQALLDLVNKKNELTKGAYNKVTGTYNELLGDNWLENVLSKNDNTIKNADKYFAGLRKYKEEEKKFIDSVATQRKNVSKDSSDYLNNLFGRNSDLDKASKSVKKAMSSALKLDFSQFNASDMDKVGKSLSDWIGKGDKVKIPKFNEYISQVDQLNSSWESGKITSLAYKDGVNNISKAMSELTGGKISTEEFAKMLKMPEYDIASEYELLNDLENANNRVKEAINNMAQEGTPKKRLQLAYELIQDETVPMQVRDKISELASDGLISDQDLEIIMNLM
ncbi:MAG: phage tail tape measure protein, partial [Sarcina sp.]